MVTFVPLCSGHHVTACELVRGRCCPLESETLRHFTFALLRRDLSPVSPPRAWGERCSSSSRGDLSQKRIPLPVLHEIRTSLQTCPFYAPCFFKKLFTFKCCGVVSGYLSLRIRYKVASVPFCNLLLHFHMVYARNSSIKRLARIFSGDLGSPLFANGTGNGRACD